MLSNKDQATIKLCVIAALADGEVSPQELATISELIAKAHGEGDATEISQYASQTAALYASQQLTKESYSAAAVAVLQELDAAEKNSNAAYVAYQSAFDVMYADNKVVDQERKFLEVVYDEGISAGLIMDSLT